MRKIFLFIILLTIPPFIATSFIMNFSIKRHADYYGLDYHPTLFGEYAEREFEFNLDCDEIKRLNPSLTYCESNDNGELWVLGSSGTTTISLKYKEHPELEHSIGK